MSSMIASHDVQTSLPDLVAAYRLARIACPQPGVQGRRAPRATARGGGAASASRPAMPLLARPRRPLGADPAAPQAAPTPSVSDAGDVAALASAAAQAALDQTPPPARSTFDTTTATTPDRADGSGEPDVGLSANPRCAHGAWVQG